MNALDQIIADALAGSPETHVAMLAREVVRLREARAVVVPEYPQVLVWQSVGHTERHAGILEGVKWARDHASAISPDRVLGEGMAAASQAYIDALENAANQFCGACREKPTCSLGIMAIGKGCGAWKLDAQRINALRANQGGANHD